MYVPIDVSAQLYATLYTVTLKFYLKKAPGIGTITCIQLSLKLKVQLKFLAIFTKKFKGMFNHLIKAN